MNLQGIVPIDIIFFIYSLLAIAFGERLGKSNTQSAHESTPPPVEGLNRSNNTRGWKNREVGIQPRNTVEYKFMEDKVWRGRWEGRGRGDGFNAPPRRFTFPRTLFSHRNSGWQLQQQQPGLCLSFHSNFTFINLGCRTSRTKSAAEE